MIKQFCVALIALITTIDGGSLSRQKTTVSEANIPSEPPIEVSINFEPNYHEYIETDDINEITNLMNECLAEMDNAHIMAEAARALGYDENHPIIKLAQQEYEDAKIHYDLYRIKYNELGWDIKAQEYPEATEIWLYLKGVGYSDYVCAGILGNIMAEVGGNTLKLKPLIFSKDYNFYGMCQWSMKYYPEAKNLSLKKQCEFLTGNIEKEIDIFGYKYKKKFTYQDFINLTDEREVALAFAKSYERCASSYYNVRKDNAEIAYEYFTN